MKQRWMFKMGLRKFNEVEMEDNRFFIEGYELFGGVEWEY